MKKKYLNIIVILLIAFLAIPTSIFADDVSVCNDGIMLPGTYGDVKYILAEDIELGSYIIGTHIFTVDGSEKYDGRLTLKHIMYASKTIWGDIDNVKILYKDGNGVIKDLVTGQEEVSNQCSDKYTYEVEYVDMIRVAEKTTNGFASTKLSKPYISSSINVNETNKYNNDIQIIVNDTNDYSTFEPTVEIPEDAIPVPQYQVYISYYENGFYSSYTNYKEFDNSDLNVLFDVDDLVFENVPGNKLFYYKVRACVNYLYDFQTGTVEPDDELFASECSEFSKPQVFVPELSVDEVTYTYTPELISEGYIFMHTKGNFESIYSEESFYDYTISNKGNVLTTLLHIPDEGVINVDFNASFNSNNLFVMKKKKFNAYFDHTAEEALLEHIRESSTDHDLTVPVLQIGDENDEIKITNADELKDEIDSIFVYYKPTDSSNYTFKSVIDNVIINLTDGEILAHVDYDFDSYDYVVRGVVVNEDGSITYTDYSNEL